MYMDKSRKRDKRDKRDKRQKTHKDKKRFQRPVKGHYQDLFMIPSTTPPNIHKISKQINRQLQHSDSYSPSINQELITLASISREEILGCNIKEAYELKEPLKIEIPFLQRKEGDDECQEYYMPDAIELLLKNLKANKHVDPYKIVPPIQSHGNCWFNAFFVTFFISDKGRKFFHFLRQLMIQGHQKDKTPMPDNLRNAFALLNYGIDCSLRGNSFAYELDTNSIIEELFQKIPDSYKEDIIVDVDEAGNPVQYYIAIMNYLENNSIQMLLLRYADQANWTSDLSKVISKRTHLPHIIIVEILEEEAVDFNQKPLSFKVNNAKYVLDCMVVRDIGHEHFCALITCEGVEMGYDGASFERLTPFEWKHRLNRDSIWEFEGSTKVDGSPMKWNFMKSYQMLFYYRVK